MFNLKQHIRKFAQDASAWNVIPEPTDLTSVAQPDHKTWVVTVTNFKGHADKLTIELVPVADSADYQITTSTQEPLWRGQFTEANFNAVMQSAFDQVQNA